jgi:hypothetical protein
MGEHRGTFFRLLRTCTQQDDRLGKEVSAIESPPSLWVFCIGIRAVQVRPSLVFATGYSGSGCIGGPLGHALCLMIRSSQEELAQVPAPY